MYMTGNSLQIFSIFMVFTLFKTPVMFTATGVYLFVAVPSPSW